MFENTKSDDVVNIGEHPQAQAVMAAISGVCATQLCGGCGLGPQWTVAVLANVIGSLVHHAGVTQEAIDNLLPGIAENIKMGWTQSEMMVGGLREGETVQ